MFTVRGRGPFPLSMLRFDEAFPASDEDANKIEESIRMFMKWEVNLRSNARHAPTVGRWESFNCKVDPVY